MSAIPVIGEMNEKDAPQISNTEFVRQVIENIAAQVKVIHAEVHEASSSCDASELKELSDFIEQLEKSATLAASLTKKISLDDDRLVTVNKLLNGSSKTLRKLEGLVALIKELETELKEAQYDYYRNVAGMMANVIQQMEHFDAFAALPQIQIVQLSIIAIQLDLQKHIQWSCREIGQLVNCDPHLDILCSETESSIDLKTLSQLYLVIDVLGVPFRRDLLERFAQLQLIPYEKIFRYTTKFAGLEHLDRRYAWFRRLLKEADDKVSAIFPTSWNLPYYLFTEFIRRTTKHMDEVLEHIPTDNLDTTAHVASLLKALKSFLKFEAEMTAAFEIQSKNIESEPLSDKKASFPAPLSITEAFDNYLGPYVQLERQSLEDLMGCLMREEEATTREEASNLDSPTLHSKDPYGSSQKMFEFIKASLKRCTTFSTGNTYLSLSKEFRICLQHYAESLQFRCPSPLSAKGGKAQFVISRSEEQHMCRIITTCEYCIDTVPQLETMMKKHINSALSDEVDFSVQIGAFMDVVSFTYSVITTGISERLEPAMMTLRKKTNVSTIDSVGDDSKYVKEIISVLNETIPRLRPCMSGPYFQGFCTKLVTVILAKLLDNIMHLKRMSKTGGGQLLLDLQGIKTYLLHMPNTRPLQGEESLIISKSFNSLVCSKAFSVERVLKLICTEDTMINETFKLLWPDGELSDLNAVLALKGSFDIIGSGGAIGRGTKGAVDDISQVLCKGTKGFKGLITGKLFEDISTHSQKSKDDDNHSITPTTPPTPSVGILKPLTQAQIRTQPQLQTQGHMYGSSNASTAVKAIGDVRNALGSLNIFGPSPPQHPPNHSSNTSNLGSTTVKKSLNSTGLKVSKV